MKRFILWGTTLGLSLAALVFAQADTGRKGKVAQKDAGGKKVSGKKLAKKGASKGTSNAVVDAGPLPVPPKVTNQLGGSHGDDTPSAKAQKKPPRPAPAKKADGN